jgi:hypothetical protein
MTYERHSIEREGVDNYLNRTAFEHGGVDWLLFDGFVERGVNVANLMRAMDIKTPETIHKYLRLRKKLKEAQAKKQAAHDQQVESLTD